MSEDTNKPFYKLTMYNLQLVLINVLIMLCSIDVVKIGKLCSPCTPELCVPEV